MHAVTQEHQAELLRKFVRRGSRAHVTRLLGKIRPEDVAVMLRGLTPAERLVVFRILIADYPDEAGDVLTELDSSVRLELLDDLEPAEIAEVLDSMPVDDSVYVLDELPQSLRGAVLELMGFDQLAEVQSQLVYEDDSAGRIMSRELFSLPEETTVRQAVAAIQDSRDLEMILYLYVTDESGRLAGVTSLRNLLLARPDRPLAEVMTRDVITVDTDTDQEEVARLSSRYDLLAIPVLDAEARLVGIVTYDDIVDVVREEATEDFLKMAGTSEGEVVYQERSLRVAGIRLPWLLINLVGLVLTGIMLERFQMRYSEALFLLTFVPVIMGMGGNSGTQTLTLVVRGLATGRLEPGQGSIRHFLWQQFKIGLYLGIALGVVVAVVAWFLETNPMFSLVVGVALFAAIVIASLNGALIPLLFQRLGVDPAVASGPMVTTSNDITGILVYFGLAALMMDWLVR